MASELSRFMAEYGAVQRAKRTAVSATNPVSGRRKRRSIVHTVTHQLEQVRDAEEQAMENTPENLRGSIHYEEAGEILSSLEEAIDILENIY
jgi:hypothetical protein